MSERPEALRLMPTKVATTSIDQHGMLVFKGDFLVAVVVQLEPSVHGERYGGKWNLEATFDNLPYPPDKVFDDLDHAQQWLTKKLGKLGLGGFAPAEPKNAVDLSLKGLEQKARRHP